MTDGDLYDMLHCLSGGSHAEKLKWIRWNGRTPLRMSYTIPMTLARKLDNPQFSNEQVGYLIRHILRYAFLAEMIEPEELDDATIELYHEFISQIKNQVNSAFYGRRGGKRTQSKRMYSKLLVITDVPKSDNIESLDILDDDLIEY